MPAPRLREQGHAAGDERAGDDAAGLMAIKPRAGASAESESMEARTFALALGALALAGCASMLPHGSTDTPSPFATFAQAEAAAARVVPFETRMAELRGLGFDPEAGRNVTLIPYPEVLSRLVPYSAVPIEGLDPGIRECIAAQAACRAYVFHFERTDRQREGGFWADFFNVRRVTGITGWWFDALVVVSDGRVLFRNVAGQARTNRVERQINPLGPFQPAGESAGAVLIR
jgi:hypothetical protein